MDYLETIEKRIFSLDTLSPVLAYWRFKGLKIVFTNGCFDILHAGHAEYLARAAALGDVLVIGLNTDSSVRRLKGNQRPVNPQQARALLLASLRFVTAVVFFEEDTPENLIEFIQPDVLVKGSDYQPHEIAGYQTVVKKGGEVVTIELIPGYSTSAIIEKLKPSE